jgi:putative ABC transport system permease protein
MSLGLLELRRLLVRQWTRRPGRALATIASVAVAVGAVVATWVSADASRSGYQKLSSAIEGVPAVDILSRTGGRFEASDLPSLGGLPGVRAVVPLFYRPTLLRVGEKRVREIAVGVDVERLVSIGMLELASGTPCVEADEVVLDENLARSLGKSVGDEILFFARRGVRRMTVVGLAVPASLRWFGEGAGVVLDIGALEDMSSALGLVDRVRVALTPEADRQAFVAAAGKALPGNLVAEIPAGRASMAEDVMHSADLGLDFVTGLTVAMSWFIVGNAMLMNVTERRRSLSLVRLLGASGRQIRRMITLEAAALGTVGAFIGVVAGLAAARPIAAGISRSLQAPLTDLLVNPLVIPASALMGILVAIAAAWWPARQAAAVDPLEGLAQAPPPPPRGIPWRFVGAALVLWAIAGVILALVLLEKLPPRAAVPAGIAMLLSFVATTPVILPPIARACAMLVPPRFRIERELALEQILRQPVRTALTTGVLVVAVSNGIGLGHAIRDNVDDILGWYARLMRADWVMTRTGAMSASAAGEGSAARAAEEDLRDIDGIERIDCIAIATGRVAGGACVIVARDVPDDAPLPLDPVDTDEASVRAALARGEAVAGTVLARRLGLAAGDELTVEVFGRSTKVKVAALVVDYTSGGASLVLRRDAAKRLFGLESADVILVSAAAGKAAALAGPLAAVAERRGMLLRSFGDVKRFIDGIVSGVVGSLWAILGLGFVVGSLGVANTVTMNVLEKRRTLGLLRAVGMTSRQVTGVVVLESLLLGLSGAIIGLLGGLTTALFIQYASQPLLGHPIRATLRPSLIAANIAAAILVTGLAAWFPARRAARLDLLEAISSE